MDPELDTELQNATASPTYAPPVVDESRDIEFWWVDVVLGIITLPLLFWALMYAVTGAEKIVATREARLKLYGVLLVLEAIIAAIIVYAVTR
jgi:hypothetical protein